MDTDTLRAKVDYFRQQSANGHQSPNDGGKSPVGESLPKPTINIGDQDLQRGTEAALHALVAANDPPELFVFAGLPARIEREAPGDAPIARHMDVDRLRHRLGRVATYVRTTAKGDVVSARPPIAVVKDILAEPTLPFPRLRAITEVPVFAPDGSLPQAAGYHEPSRTYFAPSGGLADLDIPEHPTRDEIAAARTLINDDLLGDFPFTGEAEKAHADALLLQTFARAPIPGPTPLYIFEKPTPGTGATLLVDAIAFIIIGRPAPAMTEGRDEDDMRKRLTATLRDSPSIVFFDNLRRTLDFSCLAAAITESHWKDRILGTSETIRVPILNAWVATGNNPTLSSEMTRRTVRSRLDSKMAEPWLRSHFRHPHLRAWVQEHRLALVTACLTLVRAWIDAGRPASSHGRVIGMFEEWSLVMGGILEVADIPGFLGNCREFYSRSDTEGVSIRAFLAAWWDAHGTTPVKASVLFTIATSADTPLDLAAKNEQGQRVRLGQILAQLDGRHYQLTDRLTIRIARSDKKEKGAVLWQLIPGESHSKDESSHQDSTQDSSGESRHGDADSDVFGESGESFPNATRVNEEGREKRNIGAWEIDSPHSPDSPDADETRRCIDCGKETAAGHAWCFACDPLGQ